MFFSTGGYFEYLKKSPSETPVLGLLVQLQDRFKTIDMARPGGLGTIPLAAELGSQTCPSGKNSCRGSLGLWGSLFSDQVKLVKVESLKCIPPGCLAVSKTINWTDTAKMT